MRFWMIVILLVVVAIAVPFVSDAQPRRRGMHEGGPYGDFCPGPRWGGPYGVRNPVRTADEARQVVDTYLSGDPRNAGIRAGKVEERNWYFEVEIVDRDKNVLDNVIVHKRTGRIRSTH